ncbi:hypothetical protein G7Y89_g517 [Cudoniella acicularis]|uniref:Rhodanese domain-containing protein n=1 Tax=Cudoniella acicularis TaxID=354080 RepID=A0A8H4RX12_9HELO|nr:hypothetical protein G7Y89_g517 [Cudoniella acicularis]
MTTATVATLPRLSATALSEILLDANKETSNLDALTPPKGVAIVDVRDDVWVQGRGSIIQWHAAKPSMNAAYTNINIPIADTRADHIGGHIRHSLHTPSTTLDTALPTLVRKLRDKETVVFHCALSQQRGPSAALRYIRERERLVGQGSVKLEQGSGVGSVLRKNAEDAAAKGRKGRRMASGRMFPTEAIVKPRVTTLRKTEGKICRDDRKDKKRRREEESLRSPGTSTDRSSTSDGWMLHEDSIQRRTESTTRGWATLAPRRERTTNLSDAFFVKGSAAWNREPPSGLRTGSANANGIEERTGRANEERIWRAFNNGNRNSTPTPAANPSAAGNPNPTPNSNAGANVNAQGNLNGNSNGNEHPEMQTEIYSPPPSYRSISQRLDAMHAILSGLNSDSNGSISGSGSRSRSGFGRGSRSAVALANSFSAAQERQTQIQTPPPPYRSISQRLEAMHAEFARTSSHSGGSISGSGSRSRSGFGRGSRGAGTASVTLSHTSRSQDSAARDCWERYANVGEGSSQTVEFWDGFANVSTSSHANAGSEEDVDVPPPSYSMSALDRVYQGPTQEISGEGGGSQPVSNGFGDVDLNSDGDGESGEWSADGESDGGDGDGRRSRKGGNQAGRLQEPTPGYQRDWNPWR